MTWKRGINTFESKFTRPVPIKVPTGTASHHNLSQLFCPQHHQLWKHPTLFQMQNGKIFLFHCLSECSALMPALSSTTISWTLYWYTEMAACVPLLLNKARSGFWTAAHTSFQLAATTSVLGKRVTVCLMTHLFHKYQTIAYEATSFSIIKTEYGKNS